MSLGQRDPAAMSDAQRAVYDAIAAGPRGSVPRPFLAMLDSPELASAIGALGETIRFRTELPDRLREIAICAAAAAFGSGYEWEYHERLAIESGLDRQERAAVLAGTGAGLAPGEAAVVRYVFAAVRERRASGPLLDAIVAAFGPRQAAEITAIAGYYPMLALFLAAAGMDDPLPETVQ